MGESEGEGEEKEERGKEKTVLCKFFIFSSTKDLH